MRRFSDAAVYFLIKLDLISPGKERMVRFWYYHVHLAQLLTRHVIPRSEIEYMTQRISELLDYIVESDHFINLKPTLNSHMIGHLITILQNIIIGKYYKVIWDGENIVIKVDSLLASDDDSPVAAICKVCFLNPVLKWDGLVSIRTIKKSIFSGTRMVSLQSFITRVFIMDWDKANYVLIRYEC